MTKYWRTNWEDFMNEISHLKGIEQVTSITKNSITVRIVQVRHPKLNSVLIAVGESDGTVVDLVKTD